MLCTDGRKSKERGSLWNPALVLPGEAKKEKKYFHSVEVVSGNSAKNSVGCNGVILIKFSAPFYKNVLFFTAYNAVLGKSEKNSRRAAPQPPHVPHIIWISWKLFFKIIKTADLKCFFVENG